MNKVNKIEKIDGKVFRLTEICFHEARHSEQSQFCEYSYEGLFNRLDNYMKKATFNIDYVAEHNKYFFEIEANLYGITRAKEYLKQNYSNLYEECKFQIEQKEKQYKYDYLMYDASNTIDRVISISNIEKNVFKLTTISSVLDIFLNEDNTFKNINNIIKNEKFKVLDKRIIYAFLSSQTFLKGINFNELSEEEIIIIKEALEYTNGIYKNQEKASENAKKDNIISTLRYLNSKKSIITKIAFIVNYYQRSVIKLLNFTRNENKRKKHINSVENYLETANDELEKKRTRGFLSIDMFYIIGILITIFIILYFLI